MGGNRELKVLLAIITIALFTVAAYNALTLPGKDSALLAYQSALIASFAFVWGMMVWLSYVDPVRFREVVMITIAGLIVLAMFELGIIMSGAGSRGKAVSPIGPPSPLDDALWAEAGFIAAAALLLFYFRPQPPSLETIVKEG